MFQNNKTNFTVSVIFKSLIILLCITGIIATALGDNFMSEKIILYFTNQSNICIAFISLIFLVLQIIKVKKPDLKIPNFLYIIKYICTVAITLTFLVFSVILIPYVIIKGQANYLIQLENICLHNLVPILAILDFCLFDHDFKTSKPTFVFGIILPLFYLVLSLILSLFKVDFGDGQVAPYYFLDYQANGWFSLGNGKFGVFYWIIIITLLVLGIGLLLLWLQKLAKNHKIKKQEQKN